MPCHRVAFVPREHSGAAPCGREGRCEGPFDAASAGPPCEPSLSVPRRWWGGRSGQRGSRAGKLACPRREKRWLWVTSRAERTSRAEALVVGPPRVPRPAWRPEAAVLSVLCHKALLARTKLPEGGAETSGQPRLDEGTASPATGGGRAREPACVRSHVCRVPRSDPGAVQPRPSAPPAEPGQGEPRGAWAGLTHPPGLPRPRVLIEEAGVTVARPGARPDVRATGGELGAVPRTGCAPHLLCWNPAALGGSVRGRGLREGRGHRAEPERWDVFSMSAPHRVGPAGSEGLSSREGTPWGRRGGPSCAQTLARSLAPRASTHVGKVTHGPAHPGGPSPARRPPGRRLASGSRSAPHRTLHTRGHTRPTPRCPGLFLTRRVETQVLQM